MMSTKRSLDNRSHRPLTKNQTLETFRLKMITYYDHLTSFQLNDVKQNERLTVDFELFKGGCSDEMIRGHLAAERA